MVALGTLVPHYPFHLFLNLSSVGLDIGFADNSSLRNQLLFSPGNVRMKILKRRKEENAMNKTDERRDKN